MWANAQRDGRPAEYRWRPLLNAAVWLTFGDITRMQNVSEYMLVLALCLVTNLLMSQLIKKFEYQSA